MLFEIISDNSCYNIAHSLSTLDVNGGSLLTKEAKLAYVSLAR